MGCNRSLVQGEKKVCIFLIGTSILGQMALKWTFNKSTSLFCGLYFLYSLLLIYALSPTWKSCCEIKVVVFFFELLLRLELNSSFVVLRETLVSPKLQKHTPEPVMKSAVDQHQQVFYNFYGLSCRWVNGFHCLNARAGNIHVFQPVQDSRFCCCELLRSGIR